MDIAASCDGSWQRRGHQSLYGFESCIAADTGKVIDYAIQSKFCSSCQSHNTWDPTSELYKRWKADHAPNCTINFTGTVECIYNDSTVSFTLIYYYLGSSGSMESFGAVTMWKRSIALHSLRYTTFIGDGDSSSFKSVVESAPYDVPITKSDCIGYIQKRMGSGLRLIVGKNKEVECMLKNGKIVKGISGRGRLTLNIINKIQNYYGQAIRNNIGDLDGMVKDIKTILRHYSDEHDTCPADVTSWCKYHTNRDKYVIKSNDN